MAHSYPHPHPLAQSLKARKALWRLKVKEGNSEYSKSVKASRGAALREEEKEHTAAAAAEAAKVVSKAQERAAAATTAAAAATGSAEAASAALAADHNPQTVREHKKARRAQQLAAVKVRMRTDAAATAAAALVAATAAAEKAAAAAAAGAAAAAAQAPAAAPDIGNACRGIVPSTNMQEAGLLFVEIYKHQTGPDSPWIWTLFILEQFTLAAFRRKGVMNALLLRMLRHAPELAGAAMDR